MLSPFQIVFTSLGAVLLILALFAIFLKKYKSIKFGKLRIIKRKLIVLATPKREESILLFLYVTFLLWWDVVQNKVLDFGLDYRVTWFGDITSNALDLAIVLLIIFHITLMLLFVLSLRSKGTHRLYDVIAGTIAFFGVAILLSGFINGLHSETIRFLFVDMKSISFYHIGIGLEFMAGLYWAFTK